LIAFVARFARCIRIQDAFAIHEKNVLMMAVGKFQARHPPAVRHPAHGRGISTIEIPGEQNLPRPRRVAEEKDVMQVPLRLMERRGHAYTGFKKHNVISFQEFNLFHYPDHPRTEFVPGK
jgi:hypothetical protein